MKLVRTGNLTILDQDELNAHSAVFIDDNPLDDIILSMFDDETILSDKNPKPLGQAIIIIEILEQ